MLARFAAITKWEIVVETVLRSHYAASKPACVNG
jgi:hypothetical protein